ncbi:bZIP transcription factor ABI5 homolog [Wolffia australiana]
MDEFLTNLWTSEEGKTGGEAWSGIQWARPSNPRPTGEMSLEDFLVNAGVVGEGPLNPASPGPGSSASPDMAWARKRPPAKVVERRQHRMMKNRESAARSRARKQAYTVELEKELGMLKVENAKLKEEQKRSTEQRRKMLEAAMAEQSRANLREVKPMVGLRLCRSCHW